VLVVVLGIVFFPGIIFKAIYGLVVVYLILVRKHFNQ